MPSLPTDIRHLILDRDGVLNIEAPDHGYILRCEDFRWVPGSLQALATLTTPDLRLSIATNQSPVGRGLITLQRLQSLHAAMREQAEAAGARIGGIYFCPHAPEAHCACRKPQPGLLHCAIRDSGIPASQTLMVGDDVKDVQAARAAGIAAVLVRSGKGARAAAQLQERGELLPVFDDLAHFARSFTQTHSN